MQATRLLRRNDQKLRGLMPRRIWSVRYFSSAPLRNSNKGKRDFCDNLCNESGNTSSDDSIKVTVIGAAGRVGRTLSLLLKTSPLVDDLCMFDIDKSVRGLCVDISHIDTKCSVNYVCGMRNIQEALDDPDVVLIAAGLPSSPLVNGKKLFRKNAPIVAGLSEACARFCPEACMVLITNPINSLLPVAGEVYQLVTGEKPSDKLFGLTTLDVVRANTFIAEAIRRDPSQVVVPVIGGTSEDTIVPIISQMRPCCKIKHEEIVALTECVKQAEGSLTDCQNCGTRGSSSLSTAYAAFRFSSSLISALKGDKNIVECAYVQSDILPELEYMASPLKLGTCGVEYNYGYPKLSEYEVYLMERAAPVLQRDVKMGKAYVMEQRGKHYEKRCRITGTGNGDDVVGTNFCMAADTRNLTSFIGTGSSSTHDKGKFGTELSNMPTMLTTSVPDANWMKGVEEGDAEFEVKLMESGAMVLRSDIELGKWYVGENKAAILESLNYDSESSDEKDSRGTHGKMHRIVEVCEPVESVPLVRGRCLRSGGGARGTPSAIVRSEEADSRTGAAGAWPTLVRRVIGGGQRDACGCLLPGGEAVAHELDLRNRFLTTGSSHNHPMIFSGNAAEWFTLQKLWYSTANSQSLLKDVGTRSGGKGSEWRKLFDAHAHYAQSVVTVSGVRRDANMLQRLFHTRSRETPAGACKCSANAPYCLARHPDCEGEVKLEPLKDELPCANEPIRRGNIEETKERIKQYYAAINESDRRKEDELKAGGEQSDEHFVGCLGLDTYERHKRVKRKLLRTRRERLKEIRERSDALTLSREDRLMRQLRRRQGLVEEVYELRRKNRELTARMCELEMICVKELPTEDEGSSRGKASRRESAVDNVKKILEAASVVTRSQCSRVWQSVVGSLCRMEGSEREGRARVVHHRGTRGQRPRCPFPPRGTGADDFGDSDRGKEDSDGGLEEVLADVRFPFLANLLQSNKCDGYEGSKCARQSGRKSLFK